ncbi:MULTISPECIES: branched-chain amino acid ABC transporter permease [unclassified Rhizobium]|uniref:branched-chain amino acid ABC transporter permease n=1 Tax=unclassified Rhizobium TaxID=2613769 RepID=UPI00177AB21D|nr:MULTISPECIES: branched-chain amino acid ABC transporter permease [unclassified Rhizobium]MBD8687715.1 branched-chain amino acid ABC transporter permease [Rhizobium sp. CFBP 13644]MBD8692169.1 branched-chain amino acid ABC transporter permease [Rhizobium sp. CFBP 13717]
MMPLFSKNSAPMAAMFAAALFLPLMVGDYYLQFTAKVMLLGILAMSLNLNVGFGGMVSLCHAAFFGLAGYVLVLVTPEYEAPNLVWTLFIALVVVALVAAVIGALSLRTRGIYFIMVTLAFGEMLFFLFHDTSIGGGSDGIFLYVKPLLTLGGLSIDLENPLTFYIVALVCCALSWALITHLLASPFGDSLTAARDNERRAMSLGIPVFAVRLVAFIISAVMAGLAGYMSTAQFGFVAPQMLGWHMSAVALVMVVLGGSRKVTGPLFGAVGLVMLEDILKVYLGEQWKLVYGVVIVALVLFLPGGLQDILRMMWPQGLFRRAEPVTQPIVVGGKQ